MYRIPVSATPASLAVQQRRNAWTVLAILLAAQLAMAFIWPNVTETTMGMPCPSDPTATWTKSWRTVEYGWPLDFKVSKYNLCNATPQHAWSVANLIIDSLGYLAAAAVGTLVSGVLLRPRLRTRPLS